MRGSKFILTYASIKLFMKTLIFIVWALATLLVLFVCFPKIIKYSINILDSHQGSAMVFLTFCLVLGVVPALWAARTSSEQLRIQQQPIILRTGLIPNWEWFNDKNVSSTTALAYMIYENHAISINGHVTLRGVEYPLIFSLAGPVNDGKINGIGSMYSVGWAAPNSFVLVYPDWGKGKNVNSENKIEIRYKDISGITYCSTESQDFVPKIERCD